MIEIEVRIKPLPTELQFANICRVDPSKMDDLGVGPGDLVLVANPPMLREAYARVWLRSRGARIKNESQRLKTGTLPEVEVDKSLADYLGLAISASARLSKPTANRPLVELSWVSLFSQERISDSDAQMIRRFIRSAAWPVYPGGEFIAWVGRRFFPLKVAGTQHNIGVVCEQTLISFQTADTFKVEKETLHLKNEIDRIKRSIEQLLEEQAELEREVKKLGRDAEEERKRLEDKTRIKRGIQAQIMGLPTAVQEREIKIERLQRKNAKLRSLEKEFRSRPAADFDLNRITEELDEMRKHCQERIREIEERIASVPN